MTAAPLIEVRDLKVHFRVKTGALFARDAVLKAVDGVSFTLAPGETLGVVGESGCGKSTLGRAVLKLIPPTAGEVIWLGRPIQELSTAEMRQLRRDMQIVFQDPLAALDPRMTRQQAQQAAQAHGFAGAGFAENAQHLAALRGEADIVDCMHGGFARDELHREPAHFNQRGVRGIIHLWPVPLCRGRIRGRTYGTRRHATRCPAIRPAPAPCFRTRSPPMGSASGTGSPRAGRSGWADRR